MCCYREESYGNGKIRRIGPFVCTITTIGTKKNGGVNKSPVGICLNFKSSKLGTNERCGTVHISGTNIDTTLKQLAETEGKNLKVDRKSRRRLRSLNLL